MSIVTLKMTASGEWMKCPRVMCSGWRGAGCCGKEMVPFQFPAPLPAPALTGWRSINDAAPKDGTKVDLWLHIRATPRSFGMSDSFRVTDCWWNAGSWKHRNEKGQVEDLITSYVTHYMPCPAPPTKNG